MNTYGCTDDLLKILKVKAKFNKNNQNPLPKTNNSGVCFICEREPLNVFSHKGSL